MGKIMRNGVPYCIGGDDAFRYVNDVTDENYGWIQYQLEDGNWVNYKQVELAVPWLYHNGKNYAEFERYEGVDKSFSDSVTFTTLDDLIVDFGDNLKVATSGTKGGAYFCETVISKPIDLTEYSRLKFSHISKAAYQNDYNYISIFITDTKQELMTAVATKVLLTTTTEESGDVEIDISNLTGEYYICIFIRSNINHRGALSLELIDPYFE